MYYQNPVQYSRCLDMLETPELEETNSHQYPQYPQYGRPYNQFEQKEYPRMEFPDPNSQVNYNLNYNYNAGSNIVNLPPDNVDGFTMQGFNNNSMFGTVQETMAQPVMLPINTIVTSNQVLDNAAVMNMGTTAQFETSAQLTPNNNNNNNNNNSNNNNTNANANNNTNNNTNTTTNHNSTHSFVYDSTPASHNGIEYGDYYHRVASYPSFHVNYDRTRQKSLIKKEDEDCKMNRFMMNAQLQHQQNGLNSPLNNINYSPPKMLMSMGSHEEVRGPPLRKYRVVRGMSAGGCASRPPKPQSANSCCLPVKLDIVDGSFQDICMPEWNYNENKDMRRIIRIERHQDGPNIIVKFSIVGSALDNPETVLPVKYGVDVVEVSCLKCPRRSPAYSEACSSASSSSSYADEIPDGESPKCANSATMDSKFYITSVEVVEIVETLIGIQDIEPMVRRKERGRIRSNLVPFWSKKPISSRMYDDQPQDIRGELAKRIMSYETRKPRGFDKEVRILRWEKLIPALKRAIQSYYVEIPQSESHLYQ